MKEKDFEQLVKSKLDDLEVDVPEQLWTNIERQLPGRKVVFKPVYRYIAGGIAALLAGAILMISLFDDTPRPATTPVLLPELSQSAQPAAVRPETAEPSPLAFTPETEATLKIIPPSLKKGKKVTVVPAFEKNSKNQIPEEARKPEAQNIASISVQERKSVQPEQKQRRSNLSKQYRDRETSFEDTPLFNGTNKQNKSTSVSLLASNISSNNYTTSSYQLPPKSAGYILMTSAFDPLKEELSYTHNMPLTAGLMVEKRFKGDLGIESGLTYSYLKSEYKNKSGNINGSQYLHYLGIPVNLIYHITEWGKLQVYAGVGCQIDFNIYGKRIDRIETGKAINNQTLASENTTSLKDQVQWSAGCKAGLSYPLVSLLHLYAEPAFAYHFSNHSNVENIWKEKPANFTLQVGLRANF